jgi:hypothetical protein
VQVSNKKDVRRGGSVAWKQCTKYLCLFVLTDKAMFLSDYRKPRALPSKRTTGGLQTTQQASNSTRQPYSIAVQSTLTVGDLSGCGLSPGKHRHTLP